MAGATKLPHDRGDLLWTAEQGVSRMLTSMIDGLRNSSHDSIDSPAFGSSDKIDATIAAKGDGIVAGKAMAIIYSRYGRREYGLIGAHQMVRRYQMEKKLPTSTVAKIVSCCLRSILNILGHLSGIATETRKWASKAARQVACTRKTTWGLLDKWAAPGGGLTHRLTREDALMIKKMI